MSLTSPDVATLLPDSVSSSKSFENSNFAAMSFQLDLSLCGTKGSLRIYKAQLLNIETRCNDVSGILQSASDGEGSATNMKMANAMNMCGEYPLFTQGPSSQWFSVAVDGAKIIGVDFPSKLNSFLDNEPKEKYYQTIDQSFKKHFIQDLLFNLPSSVCMPYKETCTPDHIDRNETLLLTTKNEDSHNIPGKIAVKNKITENINRNTVSSYEVTTKGALNRANSFETVHFETKPLELDSNAGVIIRRAELKTRWELFRIHGKRESSLLGNGVTKKLRGTSGCL
tara:strand:+ start:114 stop:962 length:849 start_codon:yes stop_codon:yes gene_type:complete